MQNVEIVQGEKKYRLGEIAEVSITTAPKEINRSNQNRIGKVTAIDSLTEKERSVVVLYYYEDMTLKEISLTLEVSESRVSQLHTKALNKMKKILGDYVFSL